MARKLFQGLSVITPEDGATSAFVERDEVHPPLDEQAVVETGPGWTLYDKALVLESAAERSVQDDGA